MAIKTLLLSLLTIAASQAATLSKSSSSAKSLTASTCPPATFPKPTSTTITRTEAGIVSVTSTTYYTFGVAQVTVSTAPQPGSTQTSYDYRDTASTTSTKTIFRTSTVAPHTTHVPTSCGFTPVLSEPIYRARKSIVTTRRSSIDVNTQSTVYSTVTGSTTYVPSNLFVYTITTSSTTTTISKTATVQSPTATLYDACKNNNIVGTLPDGSAVGSVSGADGYNFQYINIPSYDAVECCRACQTTPYCAASAIDLTDSEGYCFLYVRQGGDNGTAPVCDPSSNGPSVGPNIFDQTPQWLISNGPCGNWVFQSDYN